MKHGTSSLHTKKELAQTLKEAMRKKPFSKITVSEIVKSCGLNRKTFYYHFEDIYSLLKWMLEEEAIEIVKGFDLMTDYEEALFFVMDYIEKNDYMINCAYDSLGREGMKHFLYRDFYDITLNIIQSAEEQGGVRLDPDYKNFLCCFYMEALVGILLDRIQNNIDHGSRQS